MYVCLCNGITDKQIRREVARGAQSLNDLRERLGVASQCGSCSNYAIEMINELAPNQNIELGDMFEPRQNIDSGLFYSVV